MISRVSLELSYVLPSDSLIQTDAKVILEEDNSIDIPDAEPGYNRRDQSLNVMRYSSCDYSVRVQYVEVNLRILRTLLTEKSNKCISSIPYAKT